MTEPALGPGWGRKFLLRCAVDPDDPAAVRDAYESCRRDHALRLRTGEGEMDGGTYYMIVDAIKDLNGWTDFPLDWPGPYVFLQGRPLRNLLHRTNGP
jgi:hypothetical protein